MPLPSPPTPRNHRMVTLTPAEREAVRPLLRLYSHEAAARALGVHDITLRKALRGLPVRVTTAELILQAEAKP